MSSNKTKEKQIFRLSLNPLNPRNQLNPRNPINPRNPKILDNNLDVKEFDLDEISPLQQAEGTMGSSPGKTIYLSRFLPIVPN